MDSFVFCIHYFTIALESNLMWKDKIFPPAVSKKTQTCARNSNLN